MAKKKNKHAAKTLKKSCKKTWKTLRDNPRAMLFSGLLDLGFLFLVGIALSLLRRPILSRATSLYQLIAAELQQATGRTSGTSVLGMLFQSTSQPYLFGIFFWSLILLIIIYLIYWLVQGTSWQVAAKASGKAPKWKKYQSRFGRLNLTWFITLAIIWLLYMIVDVRAVTLEAMNNEPVTRFFHWVILGILILTISAMIYSQARLARKEPEKSLKKTLKEWKSPVLWGGLVVITIGILVTEALIRGAIAIHVQGGLIFGTILLLLLFYLIRVFATHLTRMVDHGD